MRKLVLALVAGSVLMAGCGADHKAPALKLGGVVKHPPGPHDTELRLRTTDVRGCSSADNKVVNVDVEETEEQIVVGAELELPDEPFWSCEIRPVVEDFTVELDRPLGQRLVIDNSRGNHSVIWSPKRQRALMDRLRVTSADAEDFMRSKYPVASRVRCRATDDPILFACELRLPSRENPVLIYGEVRSGATDLKAIPEQPSPDLREALKGE